MAACNCTRIDNPEQALKALADISKTLNRIAAVAEAGDAMCEDDSDPICILLGLIQNLALDKRDTKPEILLHEFLERLPKNV